MLLEVSEHFSDMASVFFLRVRVDENVVEVHQYTNIEEVAEDVIHEVLESSGWVGVRVPIFPIVVCVRSAYVIGAGVGFRVESGAVALLQLDL